jgi:ABC-type Fe3+/spermidine/putrescine transport system ATPase subunit
MDLVSGKIVDKSVIKKDLIEIITRTKKISDIEFGELKGYINQEVLCLDLGYSTRLGYDRNSLKTTIKVLQENIKDVRINDIFNTKYTEEQLSTSKLIIDSSTVHIEEVYEYSDNDSDKDKHRVPEFVFLTISFNSYLKI